MQSITLKRSTIAAMNEAFKIYCKKIENMPNEVKSEMGNLRSFDGYILQMCCCEIIRSSYEDLSRGEFVKKYAENMLKFEQLDKLDE